MDIYIYIYAYRCICICILDIMHIARLDIKNGYVFQIPAAFRTRTYLLVNGAPRRHAALSRAETPRLRALKTCLFSEDLYLYSYIRVCSKDAVV